MIKVVSGFMRCGTTAAMHSLIAGGLDAYFDDAAEKRMERYTDENFQPNECYYEISPQEIQVIGFPTRFEGKLIKILYGGISRFAAHPPGYLIIWMNREYEEIRQSYEATFNRKLPYNREVLHAILSDVKNIVKMRRDMKLVEIDYEQMCEDPKSVFRLLRTGYGLPIDIDAAAAAIDRRKRRFHRPQLAVGA